MTDIITDIHEFLELLSELKRNSNETQNKNECEYYEDTNEQTKFSVFSFPPQMPPGLKAQFTLETRQTLHSLSSLLTLSTNQPLGFRLTNALKVNRT